MPYPFAYGVTAAHMIAAWRDGKEWKRSSRLPAWKSLWPTPAVGRARPVDLAGGAQAAEEVVGDQVRPDAVAPGPQRRQVVVVVAVAEAREAVARVHAVHRVLKQAVQVAGRGDHLPDVARPRRER